MPYHSLTYSLTHMLTYSPQRKLEQMGGGLMETAQNATQLEVRYAQARHSKWLVIGSE